MTVGTTTEAANWFFSRTITCFIESIKENKSGRQRETKAVYYIIITFLNALCSFQVCAVLIFTLSEKATVGIIDPRNSDRVVYIVR